MPLVPLSALALAGAALLVSGQAPQAVAAPTPGTASTATASAAPTAPAATSGMVVYRDPESGGLTSTPPSPQAAAELLALESALSRSSEGLVETLASDGSPMINLQGRFQNVMMAGAPRPGLNAATGPRALCTTSAPTARALVEPSTEPLPATREEE